MACRTLKTPDGMTAIVCSRGARTKPCKVCGRPSTRLCDWPLSGEKAGKTCDAPLCDRCTTRAGEVDYCPAHAKWAPSGGR